MYLLNSTFCFSEINSLKVKVKVMMTSPPAFTDDRRYHVIKVRHGATAIIRCQATGDPPPTVTWFSPAHRVIPRSSASYSERFAVVSDGTLELRQAQKIDAGNYTCRATNSAGERSLVVGLEVEVPYLGQRFQVGGRDRSSNDPGKDHSNTEGGIQYGVISNASSNNGYGYNTGRIRNIVPSNGINIATSSDNPTPRSDSPNGFIRPVGGITTRLDTVISVGVDRSPNIGFKADSGIDRNAPGIISSGNIMRNSHSTVKEGSVESNLGTGNNEVSVEKARTDANTSGDPLKIGGSARNAGVFTSGVANNGAGSSRLWGNWVGRGANTGVPSDGRNSGAVSSVGAIGGLVTTFKRRVVKGQTVILPCPSRGSPPLTWLLPGNGVLPAPYYGSRLIVHRNGSLEMRGARVSDSGTFVCVVRGERGETRIQIELDVADPQGEARSQFRGPALESPVQKNPVPFDAPRSGAAQASSQSRPALAEKPHQRILVTQKPLQRSQYLLAAPHPIGSPPSAGPVSQPAVSTKSAPLVSIINGETLRLACPVPQTHGHTQGSLSWTMPSGKVVSRGESGESGRYSVQEDGTLIVQRASVFDRGNYICSSSGSDSSSVLAVTVPVIVIAYPPRITTGPSPVTYTRPGVAVELPCLTIATPRATLTWETPDLTQLKVMGQARIYGNRYLSPHGSLVIQNPTSRDTGFYRCTAKNVIGVDSKATYLYVI